MIIPAGAALLVVFASGSLCQRAASRLTAALDSDALDAHIVSPSHEVRSTVQNAIDALKPRLLSRDMHSFMFFRLGP